LQHATQWRKLGTELQFIPHPATWLNQRRWEDDVTALGDTTPKMPSALRRAAELYAEATEDEYDPIPRLALPAATGEIWDDDEAF
jgi:hypothetical protein